MPDIEINDRMLELREKAGRARRLAHLVGMTEWKDAMAILRELIIDALKAQNTRGNDMESVIEARGRIKGLEDFVQAVTNSRVEGEVAMEEYSRLETEVPAA